MKYFDWSEAKNNWLQKERKISFEEIVLAISNNKLLDVFDNPNKDKYPNQKVFVVEVNGYAHIIPFIEDNDKYFLKTIYPSREATKKYLAGKAKR